MTGTDPNPQLVERLVELTRDLILIPGTADRPDDRERCYAFCKNHIEGLPGIQVREFRCQGVPSFVAGANGVLEPDLLMVGHLDVVSHSDPLAYQSRIVDGRIVGPGAGDMKGALAILLELFRRLHEAHPGISLGLAVTSDEEIGGEHGLKFLVEQEGLCAGSALIPDGGSPCSVTIMEKGVMHVRLHATGTSAHGSRPWLGDNALEHLADRVAELRSWFDGLDGDGHWRPTCVLTRMYTPNLSCNRIPANAEALLDVRFPPPAHCAEFESELRRMLGEHIEMEIMLQAEPLEIAPDPLYMACVEERLGCKPELGRDDGASDARFLAASGIPMVISRPDVGLLHNVDEWIDIRSMGIFYETVEAWARRRLLESE